MTDEEMLNEIMSSMTQEEKKAGMNIQVIDCVVKAEKVMHQGQLFGHISNGGGIVPLSNGFSLKFTRDGSAFVTVQLLDAGCGRTVKNQSWVKSRVKAAKKKTMSKVTFSDNITETKLL